jgi:hypothetical protein
MTKNYYLMECLIMSNNPVLVCGHRGTGKSIFTKDMIFTQTAVFTERVLGDLFTCTSRTTNNTVKEHVGA